MNPTSPKLLRARRERSLLLPASVVVVLGTATCRDAPTAVRRSRIDLAPVCTQVDTSWIEAPGPAPEGGWIRVPIMHTDTIPC